MSQFLLFLHIVVCLALIVIVLLQAGKGAQAGATFGAGASSTVFGASGSASFMGKLTAWCAVIFMLTSLCLAYFYGLPGATSIMPETVAPAAKPGLAPDMSPLQAPASPPAEPAAPLDAAPAAPADSAPAPAAEK